MQEFFSKTFYGNTIGSWAISMLIIVGSIILSKIVYFIITKVVKGFTKKSKRKLDDILVDMIEEPIVFAIIIIGVWYGIAYLDLPEDFSSFMSKVYYILITFNVAWLITRLFDALVKEYLAPLISKSESDLDDQLLPIAQKGIKVTAWIIALVVGLNNAGYDVGALIAGLGLGGLAFAMAAKEIAIANEDVLSDNIVSTFLQFGDSALIIRLVYYIKKGSDIYDTNSAVNMEILKKFTAAGLDFAFSSQTIYTKPT